jgi:hypothetical protein
MFKKDNNNNDDEEYLELQQLHLSALTNVGRELAGVIISAIALLDDDMKSERMKLAPESHEIWNILKHATQKHYDMIDDLLEERKKFVREK